MGIGCDALQPSEGHQELVNSSKWLSLCRAVILLAAGTAFVLPVHAQDGQPADKALVWVTAGLGGATEGVAGVLGVDVLNRRHLLSFRWVTVAGGDLFSPGDEYWDVGVLYGRARRGGRSMVAASAGVGITGGKRRQGLFEAPSKSFPTSLSLPLAARAAWHPLSLLGFGIYGFANVNKEQSFAGAAFSIEVGRLR